MSTTETTSSVIPSTNRGRYALSEPDEGDDRDLTGGDALSILLGGQWRKGQIKHARRALLRSPHRPGTTTSWDRGIQPGYSFIARDGSVCGPCTGMQVRLLCEDETRRNTGVNRIRTKEESTIVQWEAHSSHTRFALLFPTQKLARMLSGDGRAVLETVGNNQMLEVSSVVIP